MPVNGKIAHMPKLTITRQSGHRTIRPNAMSMQRIQFFEFIIRKQFYDSRFDLKGTQQNYN